MPKVDACTALLVCFPGSSVGNGMTRSVGVIIVVKCTETALEAMILRYIISTIINVMHSIWFSIVSRRHG